jgi:hypothetical protein
VTGYKYDAEASRRSVHGMMWMRGWQYATVWRFIDTPDEASRLRAEGRESAPASFLAPPPGDGWEVNEDRRGGFEAVTLMYDPERNKLQQRVYWRRSVPGMEPHHLDAHLHYQRAAEPTE